MYCREVDLFILVQTLAKDAEGNIYKNNPQKICAEVWKEPFWQEGTTHGCYN